MPRFKHWEWRVGHLLLCVECSIQDPDEGERWNWNIQNRMDDDVMIDEHYELDAGGAKTSAEARAACVASATNALRDMLKMLAVPPRTFVPGRTVTDIASKRQWFPLVFVHAIGPVQAWLATEVDPGGGLQLPSNVEFIEISADDNP